MVGILLLMHDPLAGAFKATVKHLFGNSQERFDAIDVQADQDIAEVEALARDAIARLDDGAGVLVLTDILGGTPANCCGQLKVETSSIEVLTGVSLPMLLRALTYRNTDLETMIAKALSGGKNGAVRIEPVQS